MYLDRSAVNKSCSLRVFVSEHNNNVLIA